MHRYMFHMICTLLTLTFIIHAFLSIPNVKTQSRSIIEQMLTPANLPATTGHKKHPDGKINPRGTQTIIISKNGFVPNRIVCKQGDTVSFIIYNLDDKTHNIVLANYHIFSPDLRKGETAKIEFTAVKKGTFAFISNVPGYPEIGYRGILEVK
ncbi:Cupredoxin-like domain-containing protein [Aneurinibacillus thermoaerophilus]|uniref:Cupredoxin-like domain-containing protein n=1 Tax=Aneurinibacillus thermoaerophilus TaxID=143495 RepID=A0A1G8CL69_ANETH|nr:MULTISPECIES: cupredoxin domain-containing protein [Aneurinibacillus]AMA71913.1 hypothetical protein ACH33_03035 [Aneurinibacillus sp. XH2]SDH46287.1 Cupredoxin-like domain-containing protein [Aneurinibacillus thermoaerophilus]